MSKGNITFTSEKFDIAVVFVLLAERFGALNKIFRCYSRLFWVKHVNIKMFKIYLTLLGVLSVAIVFIFCIGSLTDYLIYD